MKKKFFSITLILFAIFFASVTTVNAWYIPNKTSFALGGVYDDGLDTTVDSNYVIMHIQQWDYLIQKN
ncbi:MAG: hypothetical protein PHD10_02050 [Bacilli bacterium]|nr:hypothetical protein [Bacilli bacterium]MDD4607906.1 hypothetical protein [Bacilli bacterium]